MNINIKIRIDLSQSYTKIYMTSSTFNIEPLHVYLTTTTTKGFIDRYGFMEQVKKFKFKFKTALVSFPILLTINVFYLEAYICFMDYHGRFRWTRGHRRGFIAARWLGLSVRIPLEEWPSFMNVEFCQVEVSATGRSLVQRSPTACVCVW